MSLAFDSARMRSLAERLIAIPSVSPDVAGETRAIREAAAALPAAIERGEWATADGRPVLWAFVPGSTAHTVVLLAHADTVGVDDYAALGDARGETVAFDPVALRVRLLSLATGWPEALPALALADLRTEARSPGTWLFGRGALDMKVAVAVGVELLTAMASAATPPACGVLLVVTPDEEHESQGMPAALQGLRGLRDARGLRLAGAINLDYTPRPAAYSGAMGKLEAVAYVTGRPTHAGLPFDGVDAAQVAAALALRVANSRELVDTHGDLRGVPPVTLRLRDLKQGYNAQTAHEAWVEFSVLTYARPLDHTMRLIHDEAVRALGDTLRRQFEMAAWVEPLAADRPSPVDPHERVFSYATLLERAGLAPGEEVLPPGTHAVPREAALARLRALCSRAGLAGPAIVLLLVPPYYPPLPPGDGPLAQAAAEALAGERHVGFRPYYPLVTDACYMAWRGDDPSRIAAHMPALGREYTLPHDDARALDLDVVSLGPWGHDAHGPCERVNVEYAFDRLPRLLSAVLDRLSARILAEGPSVMRSTR